MCVGSVIDDGDTVSLVATCHWWSEHHHTATLSLPPAKPHSLSPPLSLYHTPSLPSPHLLPPLLTYFYFLLLVYRIVCRIFHACHQPSQVSFRSYNGQQGCGQLGEGELGSWTFDDTGRGEGEEGGREGEERERERERRGGEGRRGREE